MTSLGPSPEFFEERFHYAESKRPKDIRYPFERDRARLIHSASFRRLQGKTQVMGTGEGDFHRTRLTHSIECAQIGAGIRDQLWRDQVRRPDRTFSTLRDWFPRRQLIETSCLAHDIGHPPFGHAGERALHGRMRKCGGFEANGHTLRLLCRLEKYHRQGAGINPTRRLILAILKYPFPYSLARIPEKLPKPPKCYLDEEADIVSWALEGFAEEERAAFTSLSDKPFHTLDCSIMELADDIAYGVHDIEDIVARALASPLEIRTSIDAAFGPIGGEIETNGGRITAEGVTKDLFENSFKRKEVIGRLVSAFITAATIEENSLFSHPLLRYRVDIPPPHRRLLNALKRTCYDLVISQAPVAQLEARGEKVVGDLFDRLLEDPEKLVPRSSWQDGQQEASAGRRVCDFVAGMTDSYAEKVYKRLFVPGFGNSNDEL